MIEITKSITKASWFQNFITIIIILSGILVGLETYPNLHQDYIEVFDQIDTVFITVFCLEILLKVVSNGPKYWEFFYDPWNVFDFFIVAIALLPLHSEFVTVLRLLRLLRVLRLLHFFPKLQMIVGALLKSIPSMGYVGLLLFLIFYMYAVAGVFIFSKNDPWNFQNLQTAFLTLFKVVTMEGWVDIMDVQIYGCTNYYSEDYLKNLCTNPEKFPLVAPFYFISFILLGTMIILNLFIGVIIQGMEEAQAQREIEEQMGTSSDFELALETEFQRLENQMQVIQHSMERIKFVMSKRNKSE
jgi:voltage-gated sodium channel